MQIFVDMDGVLADFDSGYEAAFGIRPSTKTDNVDWKKVRTREGFYFNLPPMSDMPLLWAYVAQFKPIILTGIPSSVEEAASNKTAWVRRHLGDTEIRCCLSREKYKHCSPGDILIDDWEKHKDKWVNAGGIWITHRHAAETIEQLREILQNVNSGRVRR